MVPGAGIEPARRFHRAASLRMRLPISPPRQRLYALSLICLWRATETSLFLREFCV